MAMEDPAGLPPVVQLPAEQEDPRRVGRDLVPAPDWEQQGRSGLPGERLRGKEEEGRHRLERVGGLEGFELAEKGARESKSPRAEWWYDASTLIYRSFCEHELVLTLMEVGELGYC